MDGPKGNDNDGERDAGGGHDHDDVADVQPEHQEAEGDDEQEYDGGDDEPAEYEEGSEDASDDRSDDDAWGGGYDPGIPWGDYDEDDDDDDDNNDIEEVDEYYVRWTSGYYGGYGPDVHGSDDDSEEDSDAASIEEDDDAGEAFLPAVALASLERAIQFLEGTGSDNDQEGRELFSFQVTNGIELLLDGEEGVAANSALEGGAGGDDDDDDDDDDITARLFHRFVSLFEGGGRRALHLNMAKVNMVGFRLDFEDRYPRLDVRQLFGEAFRTLPALSRLAFEMCTLPASSTLGLLAALPPPRLRELHLTECVMDAEGVAHVASLVGRPDCLIKTLKVIPADGGLDPEDCRLLCESVPSNPNLRVLHLKVKKVFASTLRGASDPAATLRELVVEGSFADDCGASLTQGLRTNNRLVCLGLIETGRCYGSVASQLSQLVDTYNITLRKVSADNSFNGMRLLRTNFSDSVRRNRWIRKVVRRLLGPNDYRVAPPSRWPHVFGSVSAFPTLLYRLLRRGDVDALCDAVRGDSKAAKGRRLARKRGHPRSPSSPS